MKVCAHRSWRMAMRHQSLKRPNMFLWRFDRRKPVTPDGGLQGGAYDDAPVDAQSSVGEPACRQARHLHDRGAHPHSPMPSTQARLIQFSEASTEQEARSFLARASAVAVRAATSSSNEPTRKTRRISAGVGAPGSRQRVLRSRTTACR